MVHAPLRTTAHWKPRTWSVPTASVCFSYDDVDPRKHAEQVLSDAKKTK
jgi:hypothetical protein